MPSDNSGPGCGCLTIICLLIIVKIAEDAGGALGMGAVLVIFPLGIWALGVAFGIFSRD